MSLRTTFIKAAKKIGVDAPLSLYEELYQAIYKGKTDAAREIIALQPQVLKGADGAGIFHHALAWERGDIVKAMAAAEPALLTETDALGRNVLLRLTEDGGLPRGFKLLLNTYAPAELLAMQDKEGNGLLHYAARDLQEGGQMVTALLEAKIFTDLDPRNKKGETPMMQAGSAYTAQWLLRAGADITATDNAGNNVTMNNIIGQRLKAAAYLMNKGGVVDFGYSEMQTRVNVAIYEGSFDFIAALNTRRKLQDQAAIDAANRAAEQAVKDQETRAQARVETMRDIVQAAATGAGPDAEAPQRAVFSSKKVAKLF